MTYLSCPGGSQVGGSSRGGVSILRLWRVVSGSGPLCRVLVVLGGYGRQWTPRLYPYAFGTSGRSKKLPHGVRVRSPPPVFF